MRKKQFLNYIALVAIGASSVFSANTMASEIDDADLMARLADMREEMEENSNIPSVKKPPSLCLGDKMQSAQNFFNNMIPDLCSQVDSDPNVEDSKFAYQNPDGGCDIGLRMPGLPDFGFNGDGFDACALAKTITSDMVDAANSSMRSELNSALNSIKEETGIEDFNLDVNANDIVTGKENYRD